MLKLGPVEIAKYPFVEDASSYIRDIGITLEKLGTDPDLQIFIDMAMKRIRTAADGGVYESLPDMLDKRRMMFETLSFLVAVILLKLCGMQTLIRRFALAEARRAEKNLGVDLRIHPADKFELAKRLIGDLFSVNIEYINGDLSVPVQDYLTRAINFHEREWNLVNRRVSKGRVYLTRHETVRLLRTEISSYIQAKIRSAKMPTMQSGFEKPVTELIDLAKRFASETVIVSGEHPPCIKHAIEILERGENLPHSGRFMLATFLLNRGQSVEQIAPLFKNAPDYNERTTMYQLRNLSGESGGGTKYTCPSCEKIKSNDMCFANEKCDGIFTPLHFGRKK
ncbi:MAG: DNA primase large subunit [Cenarchaeum symbiont of Oopsacas minuta]|nr:DNA primase large subunit [Cenarchaeum symbiont of Oopsacas minuta]